MMAPRNFGSKKDDTKALRMLWKKLWFKAHPEKVDRAAKRRSLYKTRSTWYNEEILEGVGNEGKTEVCECSQDAQIDDY
jgi:hypothetical protein